MSVSDTPVHRTMALGQLEASRAQFLASFACAPDDALAYRAPGEEYALGGLLEHVAGIMRHYAGVLRAARGAQTGEVRVGDADDHQDMAAIAAGLMASERGDAVRKLNAAHTKLVEEVQLSAPEDFGQTAPVFYGSADSAYPTSAAHVVGWVDAHYREHTAHISALLEQWAPPTAQTIAAVEKFGEATNAHDVDAMMALMTEDCVFENTQPAPDGTRIEGAERVRAAWQALFEGAPHAHFSTEQMFACGDRAVVLWRYDWGSGHVRGVDVVRVRDGRLSEKLAYVKG